MIVTLIIILETSIAVSIVAWLCFFIYRQGQQQKQAALILLENIKKDQGTKGRDLAGFLQNKLAVPEAAIKENVQLFFEKEILLLQEIIKLPAINEQQVVQIYSRLQDLLTGYYAPKVAVAGPEKKQEPKKEIKTETEYTEWLTECETKFESYLESRGLMAADIRGRLRSFEESRNKEEEKEADKQVVNSKGAKKEQAAKETNRATVSKEEAIADNNTQNKQTAEVLQPKSEPKLPSPEPKPAAVEKAADDISVQALLEKKPETEELPEQQEPKLPPPESKPAAVEKAADDVSVQALLEKKPETEELPEQQESELPPPEPKPAAIEQTADDSGVQTLLEK